MSCTSTLFEAEFIQALVSMFEVHIAFNKVLGIQIDSLEADCVTAHLQMQPQLVGHFTHQRLHGGVISACLDAMGGLAVMAALGARHMNESPKQRLARFGKLGTIDLRVDYLRPGKGDGFIVRASTVRLGSRVASTRMEFLDTTGVLLSTGCGTYIVS